MPPKLPTDLSDKWWKDNKPKTLKPTGFGQALRNYAEAKKKFDALKNHSVAAFDSLFKTTDDMLKVRDKAEKACLPKVHDDGKAALKKYEELITKDIAKYTAARSRYEAATIAVQSKAKGFGQEIDKAYGFLTSILKNHKSYEQLAGVVKKDPTKKDGAIKVVKDSLEKAKTHYATIDGEYKKLDDALKAANLDVTDSSKIDEIKKILAKNNIIQADWLKIKEANAKVMKSLA